MEVTINTTVTFENLLESKARVSQHIGGTRSGKTYAILQFLIVRGLESRQTITVVRRTIPSLKRTIIKDFTDILKSLGVWDDNDWNITDRTYKLGDSIVQFINSDGSYESYYMNKSLYDMIRMSKNNDMYHMIYYA